MNKLMIGLNMLRFDKPDWNWRLDGEAIVGSQGDKSLRLVWRDSEWAATATAGGRTGGRARRGMVGSCPLRCGHSTRRGR